MRSFLPFKGASTLTALCGQMLVLGVVLAAVVPASSVITLEIVRDPVTSAAAVDADFSAYALAAATPSTVPTEEVESVVVEHQMTARTDAVGKVTQRPSGLARTSRLGARTVLTSKPAEVSGYGLIGVTWGHGQTVAEDEVSVEFRTKTDGAWSDWEPLVYHDEHAADPGTKEARRTRPGTDEQVVGDVDQAQVRATSLDVLADMKFAVVAPGDAAASDVEKPAIDTGADSPSTGTWTQTESSSAARRSGAEEGAQASLAASIYTPSPQIYSRAQWGADESIRKKVLLYGEVHAGYVHHTASGNDYTRDQVPGILRSIYAYHVKSRGWNDIGYNYLVDRFGRIWEGRYGGIDRAVVGAHTEGYNSNAFAMSAIGNYDIKKPSAAMVQAYGTLFAWKLSLHGIDASSTRQWVGSRYFQAINGHRDAASTACPGRYLYAKLGRIRKLAAAAQQSWSGREREVDVTTDSFPDIVVRRASDKKIYVIPTGGLSGYKSTTTLASSVATGTRTIPTTDVTGDKYGDVVVLAADGTASIKAGDGTGSFDSTVSTTSVFVGYDLIAAAGDLTGDGRADFVGRSRSSKNLVIFAGTGKGTFKKASDTGVSISGLTRLSGVGDFDGDGSRDVVGGTGSKLWLYRGSATPKFSTRAQIKGSWGKYDAVTGIGDFTGDGTPDLLVRAKSTGIGFVLPGRGDGTVGARLGGYTRFKSLDEVFGAAGVAGGGLPDVVGRIGTRTVLLTNNNLVELRKPIYAGFTATGANLILNVGDWNRDGYPDLVLRTKPGRLNLRLGKGDGTFGAPKLLARGFKDVKLLAAVGDMTGDGYPDLMGQRPGGSMLIWPGQSNNRLGDPYVAKSAITATSQIGVGRWNADGAPDSMFRSGDSLTVYPGNGPGGLTTPSKISGESIDRLDWLLGVSDINGKGGHADVIARSKVTGNLYVLPGTATGLGTPKLLGEGFDVYDLAG